MDTTANLELPYIMAAQAQKHVTHNEALRALDALVQLSVADRDLAIPPSSPAEGSRYIVAASASGAWAEKSGMIAAWQDGAWAFLAPREGWICWIADEDFAAVWTGTAWVRLPGTGLGSGAVTINASPQGASSIFAIVEEELSLGGASVSSTIGIPDRAVVFGVSTRTTEAIAGAASYSCGISGDATKYGALLGIAAGSTNSGVTGPTAFYAATPVVLSANGGSFTGGKVRLAIHYMSCGVPAA